MLAADRRAPEPRQAPAWLDLLGRADWPQGHRPARRRSPRHHRPSSVAKGGSRQRFTEQLEKLAPDLLGGGLVIGLTLGKTDAVMYSRQDIDLGVVRALGESDPHRGGPGGGPLVL